MNFEEELKKYEGLIKTEVLLDAIKTPISYCPEDVTAVLPSIELGSDGPILKSLNLITKNIICEVRIHAGTKIYDFDFTDIATVDNYRFSLSEHIVKAADGTDINYEVAEIKLVHSLGTGMSSILKYVGSARDSWINSVIKALPVSIICSSHKK